MSTDQERLARVALGQLGEPGDLRMANYTAQLGAVAFYEMLAADREVDTGLRSDVAQRLAVLDPARDLELAERQGIRFVIPSDPEWPTQVDDLDRADPVERIGRAPLGLWVRGPRRLDDIRGAVAIVGARSSTTYGDDTALAIAATVAAAGRWVVSGAAVGIDYAAHRGALGGRGTTVAVLACGVDRAYPTQHTQLLDYLAQDGAIVSEAAPGRAPTRLRFLSRNRVIAALTAGTVVVEAAARSGSLNTANWASRLNRTVMGVPGPVTAATSVGVHGLLRQGVAALVTSGADVLELVGEAGTRLVEPARGAERPRDRLRTRDQQVLEAVPLGSGARVDAIARAAGISLVEVMSTMTRLEGLGLAVRDDDGWRLAAGAHR